MPFIHLPSSLRPLPPFLKMLIQSQRKSLSLSPGRIKKYIIPYRSPCVLGKGCPLPVCGFSIDNFLDILLPIHSVLCYSVPPRFPSDPCRCYSNQYCAFACHFGSVPCYAIARHLDAMPLPGGLCHALSAPCSYRPCNALASLSVSCPCNALAIFTSHCIPMPLPCFLSMPPPFIAALRNAPAMLSFPRHRSTGLFSAMPWQNLSVPFLRTSTL